MVTGSSTTSIYLQTVLNVTISDNIIKNSANHGIYLSQSTGSVTLRVDHNYLEDIMGTFVYLFGGVSGQSGKIVHVVNNQMVISNGYGIYSSYMGEVYVSDNYMQFIDNTGIWLSNQLKFGVTSNVVLNTKFDGIALAGSGVGNISFNVLEGIGSDGIQVGGCCSFAPDGVLIEGNLVSASSYSLRLESTDHIVRGNVLTSEVSYGNIYISNTLGSMNLSVTDNVMTGGGVEFGTGSSVLDPSSTFFEFQNNTLNGGTVEIIDSVSGLSFDGQSSSAKQFVIYNSSQIMISGFEFSVAAPLTIGLSDNITVKDSTFMHFGRGVTVENSGDLVFSGLFMSHSSQEMFQIINSNDITIADTTMEYSKYKMIYSSDNDGLTISNVNAMASGSLLLDSFSDSNIEISNLWGNQFDANALYIIYGTNVSITNSVLRDGNVNGITLSQSTNVEVVSNVVSEFYGTQLDIDNVIGANIRNNLLHGGYQSAYLYNAFNASFTGNHLVSHHSSVPVEVGFGEDISTTHQHNLTFTGNTISGLDGFDLPLIAIEFIAFNVTISGNYYSNYDGSGPYVFNQNVSDPSPAVSPPVQIGQLSVIGTNVSYTVGQLGNSLAFVIGGLTFYQIFKDEVLVAQGYTRGETITYDVDGLAAGTYAYTFVSPGYMRTPVVVTAVVSVMESPVTETVVEVTTTTVPGPTSTVTASTTTPTTNSTTDSDSGFSPSMLVLVGISSASLMIFVRRKKSKQN